MQQHKEAPWQRTFAAFAGPGIHQPSDTMRVTDAEARLLRAETATLDWQAPVHVGSGRHAGYLIRHATRGCTTGLFHAGILAGFYKDSSLWIAQAHRGLGLSTPLILAAAEQRGGTILPPGIVFQGYTRTGLVAHRSAHRHGVLQALAAGLPVPAVVREEIEARRLPDAA